MPIDVGPLLAYEGKEGCESMYCRRHFGLDDLTGQTVVGPCMGWHCANCDDPTGQYGHYSKGGFTCEKGDTDG